MLQPRRRVLFQRGYFISNIVGIFRNLVGNLCQFNSQKIANRTDEADHQQHYQRRTDEAPAVRLESRRDRTEHDAHDQRDRERQQHRLAEIQRAGPDDQRADRYGHPKQREAIVILVVEGLII